MPKKSLVCGQSLPGKLLELGVGLAIVGIGMDGDAATGREDACHLDVAGIHQADEVLHELILSVGGGRPGGLGVVVHARGGPVLEIVGRLDNLYLLGGKIAFHLT